MYNIEYINKEKGRLLMEFVTLALQFCLKVETGRAYSKITYKKFKDLIEKAEKLDKMESSIVEK